MLYLVRRLINSSSRRASFSFLFFPVSQSEIWHLYPKHTHEEENNSPGSYNKSLFNEKKYFYISLQ